MMVVINDKSIMIFIYLIGFFTGIWILIKTLFIICFYTIIIKRWGNTDAKVLRSGVDYFRSKNDSDTEGWRLSIEYEFEVDGIYYSNNVITKNIELLSYSKDLIKTEINQFKDKEKITVFYNKKKPKESILDNKINLNTLIFAIAGFLMIFFFGYNLIDFFSSLF